MIKAQHNSFYTWFFEHYLKFSLFRHFKQVKVLGKYTEKGLPVLLIGNHFSFWDGFISFFLARNIFHKKFHAMMLENELRERMFLNKIGCYSVRKNSRSVIETITYTSALLQQPDNLVVMYPQGEIQTSHIRQVNFDKGLSRILNKNLRIRLFFYVALTDYFSSPRPYLAVHLKEYNGDTNNPDEINHEFNKFYHLCRQNQNEEIFS
jgi:hypothetical protein